VIIIICIQRRNRDFIQGMVKGNAAMKLHIEKTLNHTAKMYDPFLSELEKKIQ